MDATCVRVGRRTITFPSHFCYHTSVLPCFRRLQNSSYFCVFKYARAVKQKVGNKAENRARLGRDVIFSLASHALRACEARALRPCKTLSPRFTDFFSDFEKNPTVLQCIVFVTFPVTHFFLFFNPCPRCSRNFAFSTCE